MYAETERAGLREFLDMQRDALIEKLRGVSDEDAKRAPTVSSLSLLSLVKHSATWERRWFQVVVAGLRFAGEWPEVQPQDENAFRLTDDDIYLHAEGTHHRLYEKLGAQLTRRDGVDGAQNRRDVHALHPQRG